MPYPTGNTHVPCSDSTLKAIKKECSRMSKELGFDVSINFCLAKKFNAPLPRVRVYKTKYENRRDKIITRLREEIKELKGQPKGRK